MVAYTYWKIREWCSRGKETILRRRFQLIVLTFCTSLTQYLCFRNGDLSASIFLPNQSTDLPCMYLLMIDKHFLSDVIVSSSSSCQILTCLVRESISLCAFLCVSKHPAYFSALFKGWERGCWELDHILDFAECSCTYFRYLLIYEWNLHCAALIPEAVTKPMCAGGDFSSEIDVYGPSFLRKH